MFRSCASGSVLRREKGNEAVTIDIFYGSEIRLGKRIWLLSKKSRDQPRKKVFVDEKEETGVHALFGREHQRRPHR